MTLLLDVAWVVVKMPSYGVLAAVSAGVAIIGWHFVRMNARAARSGASFIPPEAWRGRGALFGLQILACGAGMQILAMIVSAVPPGRL